ncbi:MAG: hypothetical protein UU47_C0005G0030 [candidate division TM6 bacterium GW2011_GWE2_41_16]|nr:MAG: hypothetical protein UU47_C0005G0030 [candidate division TM6 bacterium GW2011_GWE2_41_16]
MKNMSRFGALLLVISILPCSAQSSFMVNGLKAVVPAVKQAVTKAQPCVRCALSKAVAATKSHPRIALTVAATTATVAAGAGVVCGVKAYKKAHTQEALEKRLEKVANTDPRTAARTLKQLEKFNPSSVEGCFKGKHYKNATRFITPTGEIKPEQYDDFMKKHAGLTKNQKRVLVAAPVALAVAGGMVFAGYKFGPRVAQSAAFRTSMSKVSGAARSGVQFAGRKLGGLVRSMRNMHKPA